MITHAKRRLFFINESNSVHFSLTLSRLSLTPNPPCCVRLSALQYVSYTTGYTQANSYVAHCRPPSVFNIGSHSFHPHRPCTPCLRSPSLSRRSSTDPKGNQCSPARTFHERYTWRASMWLFARGGADSRYTWCTGG